MTKDDVIFELLDLVVHLCLSAFIVTHTMFAGFRDFPFAHFEDFGDFGDLSGRRQHRPPTFKYYDLLGVPRGATTADIRRAFKEHAKKLHPDKGGDPEKFKEVKEAYEVLADEQRRQRYDQVGDEGISDGFESEGGGTVDDLFNELLGRRSRASGRGSNSRGKNQMHTIVAQLEDIYNGATR